MGFGSSVSWHVARVDDNDDSLDKRRVEGIPNVTLGVCFELCDLAVVDQDSIVMKFAPVLPILGCATAGVAGYSVSRYMEWHKLE